MPLLGFTPNTYGAVTHYRTSYRSDFDPKYPSHLNRSIFIQIRMLVHSNSNLNKTGFTTLVRRLKYIYYSSLDLVYSRKDWNLRLVSHLAYHWLSTIQHSRHPERYTQTQPTSKQKHPVFFRSRTDQNTNHGHLIPLANISQWKANLKSSKNSAALLW